MKRFPRFLAIATALAVSTAAAASSAAEKAPAKAPDGKPVFEQYKCGSCHSIEKQGIKKAEAAPAEAGAGKVKAPDLSGVGLVRTTDWMKAFMLKTEKLDGKLHIKKFRGTEEELAVLTGWLASLKDEEAAKKLKSTGAAKAAGEPDAKSETKTDK